MADRTSPASGEAGRADPEAGLRELMRILVEQLVDDWLAEQATVERQQVVTVASAAKQVQNSNA